MLLYRSDYRCSCVNNGVLFWDAEVDIETSDGALDSVQEAIDHLAIGDSFGDLFAEVKCAFLMLLHAGRVIRHIQILMRC